MTKSSKKIRDVMGDKRLVAVAPGDSVAEAAKRMKEGDVGNVLVQDGGSIRGILTDRDIVVRALAEGLDPKTTACERVCSGDLTTLEPDDEVEHAVELMRKKAIRRLPVVEKGKPVGIVSIGDLALHRDPRSALAGISGARPNG